MSDWQPARIRMAHVEGIKPDLPENELETLKKRIVRVRPYEPTERWLKIARDNGCDGTRFFEVHEDDRPEQSGFIACEHMVLTD